MQTVDLLFLALRISAIAYVYAVILIEPGMLLGDVYGWLRRSWIGQRPFLFKPLIDCDRCVAGQIAFWYSIFRRLTCWDAAFLVAASILIIYLLQKFHKWTRM